MCNFSEICGFRFLNNLYGCIGGCMMIKGVCVVVLVRLVYLYDLKMWFFLFNVVDEEKGFKCDGLIIMRFLENECYILINLCFVVVWSDFFWIFWK